MTINWKRQAEEPSRQRYGDDHPNAKMTAEKVLRMRVEYTVGEKTQTQLAAEYGVSPATVGMIIRGETWKHVGGPTSKGSKPTMRGERHHNAKLTEEEADKILGANGTAEEVARCFLVSVSTVRNIWAGRSWKHLREETWRDIAS